MGRKRSEDAIIFKVLETCTIGATKTDIAYGVKLNFRTVVPYLDMLNKEALKMSAASWEERMT
jgi:predicted transcriptional regulator